MKCSPDRQDAHGGGSATLESLLRRLRLKSDFPALGGTLTSINRIVGTETEHTSVLSNAILKDVSMSNRLLKIVNAVAYRQFGGSISTISRAVDILENDLSIEDIEADKIRPYIPDWYRKRMTARGMLLLPVTVGTKRIGMIYADVDDPAKLRFAPQELSLLKTLRNQAVLAVRQSS